MKNFPCDILRNNVEIGWYRANAGPIQAGQCWADTIGPMLGRYRQLYRLLPWCVQCTGSVPFVPLPVQTVLASITPALAQYLYVCWVIGVKVRKNANPTRSRRSLTFSRLGYEIISKKRNYSRTTQAKSIKKAVPIYNYKARR